MTSPKPRFLVAIDFSPASAEALRVARDLAGAAGAALSVLHVRPFSNTRAAVVEERSDLLRGKGQSLSRAIGEHYRTLLKEAAAQCGARTVRLARGDPAREISREARKGYRLIVMGTRGRGALREAILGSTAQRTIRIAPIPVLVVPDRRKGRPPGGRPSGRNPATGRRRDS